MPKSVEAWRPVPWWRDRYEVSTLGRVRSIRRNRVLSIFLGNHGYPGVNLSRPERRCRALVRRLVLMAFDGPPRGDQEARQIDSDKTNCALTNLRWAKKVRAGIPHKRR